MNILNNVANLTFGGAAAATTTKGNFGQMNTPVSDDSTFPKPTMASQIITVIFMVFALFLAYKCGQKGVKVGIVEVIAAICCSPCYVAYRLVKPC
jgi:hypothetical protein